MDDGSRPTHLQDANSVGTRVANYETGLQRDNALLARRVGAVSLLLSLPSKKVD